MSQENAPELHPSIVALATLAAGVAAGHPTQPRCQLNRLRDMGIPESQIGTVVELARHVRDEAAGRADEDLDGALGTAPAAEKAETTGGCCGAEAESDPEPAAGGCCGSEPQPTKPGSCC
ncbi:hypothetical protein [Thiohalorhabdus denitrificans]|uniref:Uncharacterized protein n=1 Tax=Thiohalorhabdus denitrificans TaxID=381306 RepID=A0A1G5C2J6_9GAMM|nr:hypothetical protein [Thiohalorhabdus denitrificans]SCX96655.1 hypothetical protein SAMN05661077_0866 [Thiohalorhabdus denitrificans]